MSANHRFTATDYDDALLRLVDLAVNNNVKAAAINAGGTGYTVGDVLTVVGGTVVSSLVATLEVTSVAAGVIDGVRVLNCGAYSANPANPVSVTGGTGTLATFNLTFEAQNWILNRNVASSTAQIRYDLNVGGGGTQLFEREILLQGPGNAGTDEIYIGILEVRDTTAGTFNWALGGFTGFNGTATWEDQPGFSHIAPNEIAAFTPAANASMECWFHVSPRVLKGIIRVGSTYNNFNLGFLNQFGTPAEFPYPLFIEGCSTKWNENIGTTGVQQSGLCDPGSTSVSGGNTRGPGGLRFVDGAWYPIRNWNFNGTSRTDVDEGGIYPCNTISPANSEIPDSSRIVTAIAATRWQAICPSTGVPGSASHLLFPSDDSGGDLTQLIPCHVWLASPALQIGGDLADVFWGTTTGNNIVSQDRVIINGVYYRAFQNCNRSDAFAFVFLREDA